MVCVIDVLHVGSVPVVNWELIGILLVISNGSMIFMGACQQGAHNRKDCATTADNQTLSKMYIVPLSNSDNYGSSAEPIISRHIVQISRN